MPKSLKVVFAALCDSAYRDEETGKAILAGVFSGDILLSLFPMNLRAAFYLEVRLDDGEPHDLDLKFYVNGKNVGGLKTGKMGSKDGEPIVLLSPQVVLPLERPGTFELRISVDDGRAFSVMKKRVRLKPLPDASA